MLGAPATAILPLRGVGFDYVLNSIRWWDGMAPWFFDQQVMTRGIAASIGFPELPGIAAPDGDRDAYGRRLMLAAALSAGLLVNEDALQRPAQRQLIASLNQLKTESEALAEDGPIRRLSEAGAAVTVVLRESPAQDDAVLVVINNDAGPQAIDIDDWLGRIEGDGRDFRDLTPGAAASALLASPLSLAPSEVRIIGARPAGARIVPGASLPPAPGVARIVIERVSPELDGGRFPVKRIVGDRLQVFADIFRDGHDKISAALWLQAPGTNEWRITPMQFWDNDRWVGATRLDHVGETSFAVAGWTDHFASWRDEGSKKRAAGAAIELELIEGRHLIEAAAARALGDDQARPPGRLGRNRDAGRPNG
ncbi:MAG: maltotransferase domain-containing protein [Aliidongia sp.]